MIRSLVSLSVVTAVWDQRQHDYLDNFVPFIATMLETRGIRRIEGDDVLNLCEQFEDEFDLKLPYHPMQAILKRCVRRHLLRRSQGVYTVSQQVTTDLSFSRHRDSHIRRQNKLLEQFIEYVKKELDRDIVLEDAESALLDYLRRYDMDILFSNNDQSAIPERPRSKYDRRLSYMLSRFAIDAHASRPDVFSTLSDIALGNILTSAVLLDDYDWTGDTVRKSNIYLDSPIILRMIGTAGERQAKAFCDFVSTLRAKGAKLWVFEHSKTEAMRILEGARRWIGSSAFNPELASQTALFFRQQGYTDSEIERFILRLDDVLGQYHVKVFTQHPHMENRKFQVDKSRLQKAIESCYVPSRQFEHGFNTDAVLKDVASIAAVYRLREGKRPTRLRDAEHVFVSLNSALSHASKLTLCDEDARQLPVCVTDVFLGTILWINSPREAKEASRRRLIADCYTAVAPDAILEARIVKEARQLRDQNRITEDDYVLLSTSFVTKDLLAEKTLSDPDALDSKTSFEILEDIKGRLVGNERDALVEMESQNAIERRARERAEAELERRTATVDKMIDERARSRAGMVNLVYAIAGGVLVVGIPVVGALLVSPWAISALAVEACVGAYFSYVKRFDLKSNYERLVLKYHSRFRARYADE